MFDNPRSSITYACPKCDSEVHRPLHGVCDYECPDCRAEFRVFVDDETGRAAFIAPPKPPGPMPLGLPRGSVRALTALVLSVACWTLIVSGKPVPPILLSLLLTVIGFYFGLRSGGPAADQVFDPTIHHDRPLNLPAGCIRMLLLLGFAGAAGLLVYRNQLEENDFLEFFTILAGLLLGNLFRRFTRKIGSGHTPPIILHGKAVLVLAAAFAIATLTLLNGGNTHFAVVVLCVIVSFYYGTRS